MKVTIGEKTTWINYHHLYCFYVIAMSGGIKQAADSIGIGQSALSIQMKQFEESLGFQLFNRSPRKLVLNERGKAVLAYAKEIFRLGGEMIETINDQPTANRTHLQIGAQDTIPKHLTVQIVKKALQESQCTVSVIEGKPVDLLRSLTEYRIDLVLTNFPPNTEPGQIYSKRIARLPLWVVGGRSFLKLRKNFPLSLSGQPFVVPTGDSRVRHELDGFCKQTEITPHYLAETQDVMVQKLLALQNIGLTVVPEFAVREYLDNKKLFLIGKLNGAFEELFMLSASRKIENPVASFLMRSFQIASVI